MIISDRGDTARNTLRTWAIIAATLLAAAYLGSRPSGWWLGPAIIGTMLVILLIRPTFGLLLVVIIALVVPIQIGTGTEVKLTAVSLFLPGLLLVWLLYMARRQSAHIASSRTNLPLVLFLGAGLLSLLVGTATWDPSVPRNNNFTLVQLAQWAIFAFSAGAFWLTANLGDRKALSGLTWLFLGLGGALAIISVTPLSGDVIGRLTTAAPIRASFWILLAGLATGQLLFNQELSKPRRLLLVVILAAIFLYAFVRAREGLSTWVGISAVVLCLIWLRFPRLRWSIVGLVLILTLVGLLIPSFYQFAGGDTEWQTSGGSRLVLIQRVIEVTMRNPITGLGPAAYRPYGAMQPLPYLGAYWIVPQISSHNNYVDLFSHVGLLGLSLFFWFVIEVGRTGLRLRRRFTHGFESAYVNGILAIGVGALVIMALADWILPFVYNIGFEGFPASVLVWLFLGGLVSLEQIARMEAADREPAATATAPAVGVVRSEIAS